MFVELTFAGRQDIHWTEVPVISIVCSTGLRPASLPILILAGLLKLLAAVAILPFLATVITVLLLLTLGALLPVFALTLPRLLPLLALLTIEVASRGELSPFLGAVVIRYGWDVSSRRHVVDFCVEITVR